MAKLIVKFKSTKSFDCCLRAFMLREEPLESWQSSGLLPEYDGVVYVYNGTRIAHFKIRDSIVRITGTEREIAEFVDMHGGVDHFCEYSHSLEDVDHSLEDCEEYLNEDCHYFFSMEAMNAALSAMRSFQTGSRGALEIAYSNEPRATILKRELFAISASYPFVASDGSGHHSRKQGERSADHYKWRKQWNKHRGALNPDGSF